MRYVFPLLLAFALVCIGCEDEIVVQFPPCDCDGNNPPPQYATQDLRLQAWDVRVDGAFTGAYITVVETNDCDVTGADGWTGLLYTPQNAGRVEIIVQWRDRGSVWHSYRRGIALRHLVVTEERVFVDTSPY